MWSSHSRALMQTPSHRQLNEHALALECGIQYIDTSHGICHHHFILNRLFFSFFSPSFLLVPDPPVESLPILRSPILLVMLEANEFDCGTGAGRCWPGGGAIAGGPTWGAQYRRSITLKGINIEGLRGQVLCMETHAWYVVGRPGERLGLPGESGCSGCAVGGCAAIPPLPSDLRSLQYFSGVKICVEPMAISTDITRLAQWVTYRDTHLYQEIGRQYMLDASHCT